MEWFRLWEALDAALRAADVHVTEVKPVKGRSGDSCDKTVMREPSKRQLMPHRQPQRAQGQ